MASWRLAKALQTLLAQVNKAYPDRRKDWDGTIGDTAHSARKSDHNPNKAGVVCALDITHDPGSGFDSYAFADLLRAKKDKRVQYIISNRRIANADVSSWAWRKYSGINPHDHHVHISVRQNAKSYDDDSPWDIGETMEPDAKAAKKIVQHPLLKEGSRGEDVNRVQYLIGLPTTGRFDPATTTVMKAFQAAHGLLPDGKVGPQTWKVLDGMSSPWQPQLKS